MKASVSLGHAQATGVTSVMLRSRSRDYANHHVSVDKHPHTGRVLRTVRCALAANVLGRWVWMTASESMLDGFEANGRSRPTLTTGPTAWCWPSERDRWLLSEPVNLLRCEE